MTISEQELRFRLNLWRVPGVGVATWAKLFQIFPSAEAIYQANLSDLSQAGVNARVAQTIVQGPQDIADADIAWLQAGGNRHILFSDQADYPLALSDLPDSPPILFAMGRLELLRDPQLAMVGSRHPTAGGISNAQAFAKHLGDSGITITSGLAQGIDRASHEGALASLGSTIAVVATGLDQVYPKANQDLFDQIVDQGLVVSEFPVGTSPKAQYFPRRNRIISALSQGVLVVEAALKSGSLITARLAAEQGREVFALPGSIHNPLAKGCHALIRQGAKLVENAGDILEELSPVWQLKLAESEIESANTPKQAQDERLEDDAHSAVLCALGHDPVPVDRIVARSGLTPEAVSSILLLLEMDGQVGACGNGTYMKISPSVAENP